MAFVSFAQNFEDVMLWRALKSVSNGYYIDVGAHDPDSDTVTRAFYERGWRGINIEPVKTYHDALCRARSRDINLRLAAGPARGTRRFYEIPGTGLSTLDPEISARHARAGWQSAEHTIEQRPLRDIWSEHVTGDVHFLKIDVEGAEAEVLAGADLERQRPWIIVVEATEPLSQVSSHEAWEPMLTRADYRFVYFDGLNRFYIAAERNELAECFNAPPNCFDDFVRAREYFAVRELEQLRAKSATFSANPADAGFDPKRSTFLGLGQPEPTLADPTSQLCTQAQFGEEAYRLWCGEIKEPVRLHRKQWEFVYLLQALSRYQLLRPGMKGVGFGCGKEPLAAVMAKHGCEIVATDLDASAASGKGWIETSQHSSQLDDLNERGICDPALFARQVRFRAEDMNRISPDLTGFDFVWSSCAFEHLGSIQHGLAFVVNAMNCLKPGGIAVHTTEFNLSSNFTTLESPDLVIFRKHDIEHLVRLLEKAGHQVSPLNLNPGAGELDRHVDLPPYKAEPHLRLQLSRYVTTSIGLIVRRGA